MLINKEYTGINTPSMPKKISCPGNTSVVCVKLEKGRVINAWSTGRMMLNINFILRDISDENGNRSFINRAHCLCNDGHALAAVRALENLAGIVPPRSALLVRSMVHALRCIQQHLLHFYQFHLTNWVCLKPALKANPVLTARLADLPDQKTSYFAQYQTILNSIAKSKKKYEFPEHPDYKGSDEFHLIVYSHSLESLHIQKLIDVALSLLGYENGICSAYQIGGLPETLNLSHNVFNQLKKILRKCHNFIHSVFLKDLERLAIKYSKPHKKNKMSATFLCMGDFIRPYYSGQLFPDRIIHLKGKDFKTDSILSYPVQPKLIREEKNPKWDEPDRKYYELNLGMKGLEFQWAQGDFHRTCAPRHYKQSCEVGSFARVLCSWTYGRQDVCEVVEESLKNCGISLEDMDSSLERVWSRGIESSVLAKASVDWLDEVETILEEGEKFTNTGSYIPENGVGTGIVEVARGSLIHTIRLEKGKIVNHDYLIPSLWNFSPRDSNGIQGPLEQALMGTPVEDPAQPLEILRIVHAFDPCNPCHLFVEDMDSGQTVIIEDR